jgi:hypothetical protein
VTQVWDLKDAGLQATSRISQSSDPLALLQELSQVRRRRQRREGRVLAVKGIPPKHGLPGRRACCCRRFFQYALHDLSRIVRLTLRPAMVVTTYPPNRRHPQSFPNIVSSLTRQSVPPSLRRTVAANQRTVSPGANILMLNGMLVEVTNFELYGARSPGRGWPRSAAWGCPRVGAEPGAGAAAP